ncbi:MAG: zonular occludens toxin domain-containing protein [Brachymonas sp.]|nr:zonular occludens toxin domain-containing protein [Brachymonas sp.]
MWSGIEGIPGSGKSYEAVHYHILPALKAGRKVITNLPLQIDQIRAINPDWAALIEVRKFPQPIRGTWDADAASRGEMAFRLFEDGRTENPPDVPVFGHVWDFYDEWRGEGGIGPLYVVDECHNAWPKGLMPPKELKEVIQWAKLSRHFGADVTGITQSWRDVHGSLSILLASLIKLRKADILGKKGEYIRRVHGGYRGAELSRETRKYDPTIFPFYKSHTQSQTVQEAGLSDVSPKIVKIKRAAYAFLTVGAAFVIWAFWPKQGYSFWGVKLPDEPKAKQTVEQSKEPVPVLISAAPLPQAPASQPAEPEKKEEPFEPLMGKLIHQVGHLKMGAKELTAFVVSEGGQTFFEVTDKDLEAAGYTWKRFAHCLGVLEYPGAKKRAVTCDPPPLASGAADRPLVMDSATGAYSDDRHLRSVNVAEPTRPRTIYMEHTPAVVAERRSVTTGKE